MSIKETMLDTQSPKSKRYYTAMLKLLDSPNRELFDKSDRLVEAAGIATGQTVLEIGCGSGYFTLPASKQLGENGTLYSTDIHGIAIEETQKKVDSHHLRNVNVKKWITHCIPHLKAKHLIQSFFTVSSRLQ